MRIDFRSAVLIAFAVSLFLVGGRCESATEVTEEHADKALSLDLDPELERGLEALGYVDATPTKHPERRGVTQMAESDADAVYLYSSRRRASASLIDRRGQEVHRWTMPVNGGRRSSVAWMHVEPLADGGLVVVAKDHFLAKIDWNSEVVWQQPLPAHHDVAIKEDGTVLALLRREQTWSPPRTNTPVRVLVDHIAAVSAEGKVLETIPLLPFFAEEVERIRWPRMRRKLSMDAASRAQQGSRPPRGLADLSRAGGVGDLLHCNAISQLHKAIPGIAAPGALLLSFRALSRIAIVSADGSKRLWLWGEGILDGQHDVTQLENGHLLLFDNGLSRGAPSRVLEVDAQNGTVVWSFNGGAQANRPALFSRLRGGAQGLARGHVLITESDRGHALEIDRAGETVWEFWNPDVHGQRAQAQRAVIYRMNRFPRAFFPRLRKNTGATSS